MQAPVVNRQWIYVERPEGELRPEYFDLRNGEIPVPRPGEALVRVRAISVDPAQRAWMRAATYRPRLEPGDVMAAYGLAEVLASHTPDLQPGNIVEGDFGWQEYTTVSSAQVTHRDSTQALTHLIGLLNITGLTAYFGLLDIGRPRPGETVVVSAAAGAVGCIVVQLARLAGCRVVGVAGGAEKCRWLTEELGVHAVVDYKAPGLREELAAACPQGVDVYFDNTAGDILEATLDLMNQNGRVVCCGAVSQYNQVGSSHGLRAGMPGVLVRKRIRMEGFIVFDHYAKRVSAEAALVNLIRSGALKAPVHVVEGLKNAPQALIDLLNGRHRGKMMIRI